MLHRRTFLAGLIATAFAPAVKAAPVAQVAGASLKPAGLLLGRDQTAIFTYTPRKGYILLCEPEPWTFLKA